MRFRGKQFVRPIKTEATQGKRLVSVVIPCFNYENYLPQAVDSVLSQAGVLVEVIIVDDCSTDNSLQVASKIANNDNRVTVLRHSVNTGPARTFNDGLAHACGEYLVRLDADDMLSPGSLKRAVALATANPTVGLVYGHPVHFIESLHPAPPAKTWGRAVTVLPGTSPRARSSVTFWTITSGQKWLSDRCRSGLNVITSPEVLMRRSVVTLVGGQKNLAHAHDMELWLRIAAYSDVGFISGADQAFHRDHSESLSVRFTGPLTDLEERRDAFRLLFEDVGKVVDNSEHLERSAYRALAREAIERVIRAHDHSRVTKDPVTDLESFALDVDPEVTTSHIYRALNYRRKLAHLMPGALPLFVGSMLLRRTRFLWAGRRWLLLGV